MQYLPQNKCIVQPQPRCNSN